MHMQLRDPALLRQSAYFAGQWRDARSGATLEVVNPATGERIGTVPLATVLTPARPSRPRQQHSLRGDP